jgi:hypothetical protein
MNKTMGSDTVCCLKKLFSTNILISCTLENHLLFHNNAEAHLRPQSSCPCLLPVLRNEGPLEAMQGHQQRTQKNPRQWHFMSQEETCRITSNRGTDARRNVQQQKEAAFKVAYSLWITWMWCQIVVISNELGGTWTEAVMLP